MKRGITLEQLHEITSKFDILDRVQIVDKRRKPNGQMYKSKLLIKGLGEKGRVVGIYVASLIVNPYIVRLDSGKEYHCWENHLEKIPEDFMEDDVDET